MIMLDINIFISNKTFIKNYIIFRIIFYIYLCSVIYIKLYNIYKDIKGGIFFEKSMILFQ